MFGKRGTEKPIEIFVALFVILAVALVMLKLFQNQITEKQTELQSFQQEKKQQELREKAALHCKSKCNDASNDGCSLKSLASFCLAYGSDQVKSPDFLDLNLNRINDFDTTLMAGIGVCEDSVPCHAFVSSCCGQQITGSSCRSLLETYWTSQGFAGTELGCLIDANVKAGSCTPPTGSAFWYERDGYAAAAATCP